jgi:uncharacterized membrane protein YidH (DUF202 family)
MSPPPVSSHADIARAHTAPGLTLHSDFWVGGFFAAAGGVVWQQGATLRQGTAANMGSGFVPFWLGVGLVLVGTLIAVLSLRRPAPNAPNTEISAIHAVQPIAMTTAALVAFSFALDYLGLFLASATLVALSRLDSWKRHPLEVALLSVLLAAASSAIFRYGLGVPVPIWPA